MFLMFIPRVIFPLPPPSIRLHINPSTPMLPFAATCALDRSITAILCASTFIEAEIQYTKAVELTRVQDLVRRTPTGDESPLAPLHTKEHFHRASKSQRPSSASYLRSSINSPSASLSTNKFDASADMTNNGSRIKCSNCHGFIPLRQTRIRVPLQEGSLQVGANGVTLTTHQFCSWRCAKQWTSRAGKQNKRPMSASGVRRAGEG